MIGKDQKTLTLSSLPWGLVAVRRTGWNFAKTSRSSWIRSNGNISSPPNAALIASRSLSTVRAPLLYTPRVNTYDRSTT